MNEVVKRGGDGVALSVEERNLLSVAYKNVIGALRAAFRIVQSIHDKEKEHGDEGKEQMVKEYLDTITKELEGTCADILALINDKLLAEARVRLFF